MRGRRKREVSVANSSLTGDLSVGGRREGLRAAAVAASVMGDVARPTHLLDCSLFIFT